jgi:hypothetical protein
MDTNRPNSLADLVRLAPHLTEVEHLHNLLDQSYELLVLKTLLRMLLLPTGTPDDAPAKRAALMTRLIDACKAGVK